jgi:xanthine dehydrogenase YagS FAD-binding subunit
METFQFIVAESVADAVAQAACSSSSRYYAGGTTLVDLMKEGVERPDTIVDLNLLTSLARIDRGDGGCGLHVGALVRNSDLAQHPIVCVEYPMLAQAVLAGASGQIRNMATVGGNLMQRTRCPYFRDPGFACGKRDPGSHCSAIGGLNRGHAILGTSDHCIATHPSDMAVAMTALDASIHVVSVSGDTRVIPLGAFYRLPGDTPQRETELDRHELITAVEIPSHVTAHNSIYLKVRDRASFEFALVSAAVALNVFDGRIRDSRVALGGVGTVPWRAREAEAVLDGAVPTVAIFDAAADAALANAVPRGGNDFKVPLAHATIVRALRTLVSPIG